MNKTKRLLWLLLIVISLVLAWLFVPYTVPTGGAKDTDGDGRVDYFWDGSMKITNFHRYF